MRRFSLALLLVVTLRPCVAEIIQLEGQHGTYTVPVRINGAMTLPFVLDTGASAVAIPEDVFLTLTRIGTVRTSDFIGTGTVVLADGSQHASRRFVLHEVQVGSYVVTNVVASVVSVKGDPLLGQSFLSKLPAWSIDNQSRSLVLRDQAGLTAPPAQTNPAQPHPSAAYGYGGSFAGYGAISWDQSTGKYGASWNQPSPKRAEEAALGECGASGCKVVQRIGPRMCGALAETGDTKQAGAAVRGDREAARLAALAACEKNKAGECVVKSTDCNK